MYPENVRTLPLSRKNRRFHRVLPRAGFILTRRKPPRCACLYPLVVGISLEQSYQTGACSSRGFIQTYRGIIPESVAGANAGARMETFDAAIEQRFVTGTYLSLRGQILNSQVPATVGAFQIDADQPPQNRVIYSGSRKISITANVRSSSR